MSSHSGDGAAVDNNALTLNEGKTSENLKVTINNANTKLSDHKNDGGVIDNNALIAFSREFHQVVVTVSRNSYMIDSLSKVLRKVVEGSHNCPSLFILYPKKMSLGERIMNVKQTLFQDVMMLSVVCPETMKMVECGPNGAGWEVVNAKKWVKKWGPALLCAIRVFQIAALTGRLLGFPIPSIPSAREMGIVGSNEILDGLGSLWDTYASAGLEDNLQWAKDGIQIAQKCSVDNVEAFQQSNVVRLSGESYDSIEKFLTTGDNLQLGDLHNQLRNRMERISGEDGSLDWVSIEGKESWLMKHKGIPSKEYKEDLIPSNVKSCDEGLSSPSYIAGVSHAVTSNIEEVYVSSNSTLTELLRSKLNTKEENITRCMQLFDKHDISDVETFTDMSESEVVELLGDTEIVLVTGVKTRIRRIHRETVLAKKENSIMQFGNENVAEHMQTLTQRMNQLESNNSTGMDTVTKE